MVFCNLRREISPLCVQKNICYGIGSRNGFNGTPLYPPLFWLDNIFKQMCINDNKKSKTKILQMEDTLKKRLPIFPSPAGMSLTKLSLPFYSACENKSGKMRAH
jgi:hypothetical protein